ncbi:MAG: response regulator transcription factor [Christensenellaceae bacterium]|jgi:DNA-binding response OmpR family regulator|nr:response regulator transcription factor [Christensenellaceae bacterium]
MYRVLIADDEAGIRNIVSRYAKSEGHIVYEASNGEAAINIVAKEKPDIAIIDIMMPELDGFSTTKEIRKFSDIPIVILSARDEEFNRIHGFEVGADDYVIKPFSGKELMLRINALISRSKPQPVQKEIFETDQMKIDYTARILYIEGNRVNLSPKEYELLFFMVRNNGIALSRPVLLSKVWGYDCFGDDRTIDTHIKLLRRNLGPCGKYIATLRGMGYRFEAKPLEA